MTKPKYTLFRPRIRSRHPSHSILREKVLPLLPFKSIVRLGSQTEFNKDDSKRIEVNSVEAIKTSCNKLRMKTAFTEKEVATADWWHIVDADGFVAYPKLNTTEHIALSELPFPIISKSLFGSRNKGNTKHDTIEELTTWLKGKNLKGYIFEKYYNYTREYRLHVTADGCFYSCRKMLKSDTPEEDKWYRNDAHCVWVMEENPLFDKPINWNSVVKESVKALKAVGLDVGAVDLRIQSANTEEDKKRKAPKFIIIEINSAPSFGDITQEKYIEEIPKILKNKFNLQTA
ncbi:MAG: hypothetical protein ACSLE0_08210 [Chitinophagaceae bacterium]